MDAQPFLDAHLNINWLRPESALTDAIASSIIAKFPFHPPSLDLGSGNGISRFITAGGTFSPDYDRWRNAEASGFWENRDIYDVCIEPPRPQWIIKTPGYLIDYALDAKRSLLLQARALDLYRQAIVTDADRSLPFEDGSFQTLFSNMLYWLHSPGFALQEVHRILRRGGHALLCLQDHKFKEYCVSYQWKDLNSETLRLLNRGRSESIRWTISYEELAAIAGKIGFKMIAHTYYLSPLTLKVWDIGLRPLSPVLIKMVQKLSESDRLAIKSEWIATLRPFLAELYECDRENTEQGGYHFVCLEKA